jgi:exonuclease SbcD
MDNGRIRYSGSPIPLSFSEERYEHQILEVTLEAGRVSAVTPHLVPRAVPLLRLPAQANAPLAELLSLLARLPASADLPTSVWPYLEINLLDDGPDPKGNLGLLPARTQALHGLMDGYVGLAGRN